MSFYPDAEAFYAIMREIFDRLNADPRAIADFQSKKMAVRIRCSDPEAEFFVDGRSNPLKASVGPQPGRPDLALELQADLLHDILMGTESLKAAFLNGRIKVTGNVFRAMQLADLFRQVEKLYPQVLRDAGYGV